MMRRLLLLLVLVLAVATSAAAQVHVVPSAAAPLEGTLLTSFTGPQASTPASSDETDLWTFSLPANALAQDGDSIRVVMRGGIGATAGTKSLKFYFGATAGTVTSTQTGTSWSLEAVVTRASATTQLGVLRSFVGNSATSVTSMAPSATLSGAVTLKMAGIGVSAGSDVSLALVTVELLARSNGTVFGTGGSVNSVVTAPDGSATAPSYAFNTDTDTGMYLVSPDVLRFATGGAARMDVTTSSLAIYGANSATIALGDTNLLLARDGNHAFAQRNGANAQTFRLYNTYTDASNYERLAVSWSTNKLFISTDQAGTGTARNMTLRTVGNASTFLGSNNTDRWEINPSGHFLAVADNTYDIGASGATRPRNVYAGTQFVNGSDGIYFWSSRSRMDSPSDGVIKLANNANTDFTRLQFGGTTSSFPALKRNGTSLEVRLADDSGPASLTANVLTLGSSVVMPAGEVDGLNPSADHIRFYVREDLSITGTATADCLFRARLSDGTEITIATLVTDGGCP
jgi:hypothetical protein